MITEPTNQMFDIEVGLASIPAPIAVPAMIIAPPRRDGSFCLFIFKLRVKDQQLTFETCDPPQLHSYLGKNIEQTKKYNKINHSLTSVHFISSMRKFLSAGMYQ